MKKLTVRTISAFAIIITASIWHFTSSHHKVVHTKMSEKINVERINTNMGEYPEYLATTDLRIENLPDEVDNPYEVKVNVRLYEDANYTKEITNLAYELQDNIKVFNGVQPVRVKVRLNDSARTYDRIHIRISAELEKIHI